MRQVWTSSTLHAISQEPPKSLFLCLSSKVHTSYQLPLISTHVISIALLQYSSFNPKPKLYHRLHLQFHCNNIVINILSATTNLMSESILPDLSFLSPAN